MNFVVPIVIFVVDQLTKLFVIRNFGLGDSMPVIKNIFHITYVRNNGIAFGILGGFNLFFIFFSIAFLAFITGYFIKHYKIIAYDIFLRIGFLLLIGGISGNLFDRIFRGSVIDFLDLRIWPVFNIADSCISIASIFFLIHIFRNKKS